MQAELLIHAQWVLPVDPRDRVLTDHALAVGRWAHPGPSPECRGRGGHPGSPDPGAPRACPDSQV